MKTRITAIIVVVVMVFSVLALSSCKEKNEEPSYPNFSEDLFTASTVTDKSGQTVTTYKGVGGDYLDITFPEKKNLNTVVLKENGGNVSEFKLYYKADDGKYTFIYRQDMIEGYRYCTFATVCTTSIRLEICSTYENANWALDAIEIYYMRKTYSEDFRVSGYCVVNNFYKAESIPQDLSVLTKAIIIGNTCFDKDGNLYFENVTIDGQVIDGRQVFERALNNIRAKVSPETVIEVCLLARSQEAYRGAIFDNESTFVLNIRNFANNFAIDGISFDWEYPEGLVEYNNFLKFLSRLEENMPERTLSCAIASYSFVDPFSFNRKYLNSLDSIECMSYDIFNEQGHHSAFYETVYRPVSISAFLNTYEKESMTLDLKKLDIGLPFYSRPIDQAAFWGTYNQVASTLGRYNNIIDTEKNGDVSVGTTYYNCYQMIYDKTAYCIDNGVGGVMIWHVSCDLASGSELSLLGAIKSAIESRK